MGNHQRRKKSLAIYLGWCKTGGIKRKRHIWDRSALTCSWDQRSVMFQSKIAKSGLCLPQMNYLNEGGSFTPGEELYQCKCWNHERKGVSESLIFFWESASFFSNQSCAAYENFKNIQTWWPSEDVKRKLGFKLFLSSSFPPLFLPLPSSLSAPSSLCPSSLPLFLSFPFTIGSHWGVFWAAWQHIIKSSKLGGSAQVCSTKPTSSSALLADSNWFFVDKERSTYIIRFVLFLPMIKRRRFALPAFEIFAEGHIQQTSLLRASTIVIRLQIFFFPPSSLPP